MNQLRSLAYCFGAETLNVILHRVAIITLGAASATTFHVLSTIVTGLIIVLAARVAVRSGRTRLASALIASLIWVWSMFCGGVLTAMGFPPSSDGYDTSTVMYGLVLASLLGWPIAIAVGLLAAWVFNRGRGSDPRTAT